MEECDILVAARRTSFDDGDLILARSGVERLADDIGIASLSESSRREQDRDENAYGSHGKALRSRVRRPPHRIEDDDC